MLHDVSHAFVDLQTQRRLRYPLENALEASEARFRFSLKSLFIFVTVCAIWFGILKALGATLFGGVAYSAGFVPVALLSWFFFRSLPKRAPRMRIGSWPSMVVSTLLAGGLFGALCFIQSAQDVENAFIGPLFGMFFGWLFSTAGLIYTAPVLILLDAISRGRCPRVWMFTILGACTGFVSAGGFSINSLYEWQGSVFPLFAALLGAMHNGIAGWQIDRGKRLALQHGHTSTETDSVA